MCIQRASRVGEQRLWYLNKLILGITRHFYLWEHTPSMLTQPHEKMEYSLVALAIESKL